jgi:D-tyrosyl-tRNA(Tyr) deacylase
MSAGKSGGAGKRSPRIGGKQLRQQERKFVRAVVQRVSRARVTVDDRVVGEIQDGVVVLLGVSRADTLEAAQYLAEKIANLRVFSDEQGKMNRTLLDIGGSALVVSQFTLYGDTRGGRRPSYIQAAPPEEAKRLYEDFVRCLRTLGVPVETGKFQAHMEVELVNDGPVTILLDSEKTF